MMFTILKNTIFITTMTAIYLFCQRNFCVRNVAAICDRVAVTVISGRKHTKYHQARVAVSIAY